MNAERGGPERGAQLEREAEVRHLGNAPHALLVRSEGQMSLAECELGILTRGTLDFLMNV